MIGIISIFIHVLSTFIDGICTFTETPCTFMDVRSIFIDIGVKVQFCSPELWYYINSSNLWVDGYAGLFAGLAAGSDGSHGTVKKMSLILA